MMYKELCNMCDNWTLESCDECDLPVCHECVDAHIDSHEDNSDE